MHVWKCILFENIEFGFLKTSQFQVRPLQTVAQHLRINYYLCNKII